jgi:hypothetical protein
MHSTRSRGFSAAHIAGGRLPPDSQGQPEDALPANRRSAAWKAPHPFHRNRSRVWPWAEHHLVPECKRDAGAHQGRLAGHQLDRGSDRHGHPRWQAVQDHPPPSHQPADHTKCVLRLARERWSVESWHLIRDTQIHEDDHRYRGHGAGVVAGLRTEAMNLLHLIGFRSIREGLQAVMHDITAMLAMV